MPLCEVARAKVNLTLKVLGRRPDGYHEIESLVTFAAIADHVTFFPGQDLRVSASGPFAADIIGGNLLERALVSLRGLDAGLQLGAAQLEKNLPVAAGLGGGSADAAALLRAVRRANSERASTIPWGAIAAKLGADVPVCLTGAPALTCGVGDRVVSLPRGLGLPPIAAVLVNPGQRLATADVYLALGAPETPDDRYTPTPPGPFANLADLIDFMRERGNDLERPATALLPVIPAIKSAIAACPGCRLATLSGSGPTCYGIFTTQDQAAEAARVLAAAMPGYWITPTHLEGGGAVEDLISSPG